MTVSEPIPGHRRALLLINPRARQGSAPLAAARAQLQAGAIDVVEAPWPDRAAGSHALADLIRRHARAADRAVDLVIVGGGDGTLNAVAPALSDTGLPLGVLPLGTANDFARTLGIPADPVAAARLLITAEPRPVDLGEVNGHPFLNVASIGFSADLARALTTEAKRRFGVLGYGIVAARLLWQSRLFTAFIEHDETVETVRTLQVSVGNGRYYGGGMAVAETATADDGHLDFYSLEVDHWWRLLALLPSLRRGTQGQWNDVRAFRTTEVVVRTSRPRPVNTDGELVTFTPAHFKIRPGALRVLAPPPTAVGVAPAFPSLWSSPSQGAS
ncbi:lipid kinase [Xanthobacter agilis]|uniref:YegS/Rv2252/BmrU family lipid kinase n=1 Tax=Xanthobacter agilis TaxID=47492 RepID=A0ABU0LEY7_XANAG|nr:lipid kinase [Xanthobacter agilis]MDQ0505673.1 YegS/Rv2252/BmrU family lipid kinase [Xanthobacter agilis]